jgi:hypothetical protein
MKLQISSPTHQTVPLSFCLSPLPHTQYFILALNTYEYNNVLELHSYPQAYSHLHLGPFPPETIPHVSDSGRCNKFENGLLLLSFSLHPKPTLEIKALKKTMIRSGNTCLIGDRMGSLLKTELLVGSDSLCEVMVSVVAEVVCFEEAKSQMGELSGLSTEVISVRNHAKNSFNVGRVFKYPKNESLNKNFSNFQFKNNDTTDKMVKSNKIIEEEFNTPKNLKKTYKSNEKKFGTKSTKISAFYDFGSSNSTKNKNFNSLHMSNFFSEPKTPLKLEKKVFNTPGNKQKRCNDTTKKENNVFHNMVLDKKKPPHLHHNITYIICFSNLGKLKIINFLTKYKKNHFSTTSFPISHK